MGIAPIVAAILFISCNLALSFDDEEATVKIHSFRNDAVTIVWNLPPDISNRTTSQRLMIAVVRSSLPNSKTSISAKVASDLRTYTFTNLVGNTTYRVSVEPFQYDESLWYASNMVTTSLASLNWLPAPTDVTLLDKTDTTLEISWNAPIVQDTGHSAIINQHLLNVYEFNPKSKQFNMKFTQNIPVQQRTYKITRLFPGAVYNITLEAGTSYGYGNMAWSAFSTLQSMEDSYVLQLEQKTPNSLTLAWPLKWLPTPTSRFTIRAKTVHSPDNVEKEIQMSGLGEPGRPTEFVLRNLHPGSTYNVSISTNVVEPSKSSGKWTGGPSRRKTAWSVFSTLTQGEYAVVDPRIVVETETAVSIVFQPLRQLGDVAYQMRYMATDESKATETSAYSEAELVCPKFGCEWMCALIFNLHRRPRDFKFEIRAKVDDVWNKWIPIARKTWTLLERACSINPPPSLVENVGNHDYQREIEIASAPPHSPIIEPWRYLVVVDSRQADYSALDITQLADRATADIDHIPYYIAGSLSPQQVADKVDFRLGDGSVRGGYLNYPLREKDVDPRWTLVPLSQSENEMMEKKTCGFTQEGQFECEMSLWELTSHVPWWLKAASLVFLGILLFSLLVFLYCFARKICDKRSGTKESSVMYYHNESPNTTAMTRDFRRVERREFKPADMEERMRFME